jgi:hypothetical protein
MSNKNRDFERGTEPRDTNPGMGAEDRVEQMRGTANDEADEFEESDDEEMDEEDERDEGNFQ